MKIKGTLEQLKFKMKLLDQTKEYELSEYKETRSLNSNSYAWKLCTQIADKLNLTKDEVYIQMLKDYGQSMLIPVAKGEVPKGYFKYYEYETTSKLNGKEADWYKVFKGSSNYDTSEMWVFIQGIEQEARAQEIETLEERKLRLLMESWEKICQKTN